jgi:serine/threonine-protein kinase
MEYVDGISLQTLVTRHGTLPVGTACHYARQVAFGLQNAHEMGFVHRDIKPANLLLDRVGVVKILDLGLVRSEADAASGLTRKLDSRSILGTADYVAPEQAVDGSGVDIRADIYSLGGTLYFLLAGRPLFPDGRTAQKLVWQQIKDPTPIDVLRPEVPVELAAVVHKMLAKKPADRFETPIQVFEALEQFVPEEVPPPDPNWMPPTAARVAISRATLPGAHAPRVSGSTSQILAAALRGGSGSLSSSSGSRPGLPHNQDTGRLGITPTNLTRDDVAMSPTDAMAKDDTQRTPSHRDPPATPGPIAPTEHWQVNPAIIIAALATALFLAVVGIIVLLLRD